MSTLHRCMFFALQIFASEKKTTLWSLALVELEEWKAVQQREIWKSRHIQAMKARILEPLTVKFWHIKSPWWRTVFPRSLPVGSPSSLFQSHFVNSCHRPFHSGAQQSQEEGKKMKKVVVTWSIPTLHNLQHLHEILLHLASLTAKTGGNAGIATKFKPTTSCCEIQGDPEIPKSNLNQISCHAGQRQIPWRLSNLSLEALQGLKVHLFAWLKTR